MRSSSGQAPRFDVGTMDGHRTDMSDDGKTILAACMQGIDVTELYSPERINKICNEFGLQRGTSMDLRTGWNFNLEEHRHAAWEQIRRDKPLFVIGSPPMHNVLPAPDDEPGDQGQVPRGNAEVPACNG